LALEWQQPQVAVEHQRWLTVIWTAWNNGKHHSFGAGYGFKIAIADRDRYFQEDWQTAVIELPASGAIRHVVVNLATSSFWSETRREVIAQDIGRWLRAENYVPRPSGQPPMFEVEVHGKAQFRVKSPVKR
jgi:hypothetical protein